MSLIDPLLDRIQDIKASMSGQLVLRWGTVTQESPLRVRLDADTDPLPFKPMTLVAGLDVGDRVQVALQNRRATVIGRGGGIPPAPEPDPFGLVPVIPATVEKAGAGSTVTVGDLGKIVFTDCTSLSLNDIFTDTYLAYRLIISIDTATADNAIYGRLRSGGTDYSGAVYQAKAATVNAAGAVSGIGESSATAGRFGWASNGAVALGTSIVDVLNPTRALNATWIASSSAYVGGTIYGLLPNTSLYDGLTLYIGGSTAISGSVQVYAYNE